MRRPILALLDSEEGYAVRFMEYVNRQNKIPFEVRAFTDSAQLQLFLLKCRPAILLVSEKDLTDEVREWNGGPRILLTEQQSRDQDGICKYQSVSAILRDVMRVYGGDTLGNRPGEAPYTLLKKKTKVIGIFSPVGRCMKTAFSMTLGQCLARRKPTILIELECCSGFEEILHTTFEQDISEAIYYLRSGEKNPAAKLAALIQTVGDLDYLPPFRAPGELFGMTTEDLEQLVYLLTEASTYEAVVIDFGIIPIIYPGILELCDIIYMPERQDYVARMKVKSFMQQDSEEGMLSIGERIEERLRKLQLNDRSLPMNGDRWFESMPYSKLGEYAEECIVRDEL